MSLLQAFKNLSPLNRLGVGVALIAWGCAGPYVADWMEHKYGFKPTPEDEAVIEKYTPKVVPMDKKQSP